MNCFRRCQGYREFDRDRTAPRSVHPGERQIQARDLKIRQRESSKDVILSAQKIKYLQELKKRKCSNAHIRTVIITAESLELLDEFWSLITAATNS